MKSLQISAAISGRNKEARAFKDKWVQKKQELIDKAIAWKGDKSNNPNKIIYHDLWQSPDGIYKVSLGKYGKEFYRSDIKWKDGHKDNNPNDMKPSIFKKDELLNFDGSFDYIFHCFQEIYKASEKALQVLGCLLFRNAYMLDHDASLNYNPPRDAVRLIEQDFPLYNGIPIEVFLHYLEALAINEDVKYFTIGYDIRKDGAGRLNNMLTYAHLISVLLGHASLAKLCSNFSRPPVGVAPISINEAKKTFPDLGL